MNKDAFIAAVRAAGIVGEGGAGFPAHVKYAAEADTVIANGCECEPLLHSDQHIMAHEGEALMRGLRALTDAVGAKRGVLGIKKKHTALIPELRLAAEAKGLEVFLMDDFYPAGDEQILVREVTGRSVPPLGIPLHVGAVVANVSTLVNVDAAMGGKGAPSPVTDKILTVTGRVARPGVVRAPIGTNLADCLAACGGASVTDPVFIVGGPMMGRLVDSSVKLGFEVVTKTTGGLIVLPSGHPLHQNASLAVETMRRRAASACIQCRACSDLCPRALIGHPFATHKVMRAFAGRNETAADIAMMCCECGVCEHYACPMGLSPRRINQSVKASLRGANLNYAGPRDVVEANTRWRSYRKTPVPRLAARLGIGQFMKMETPFVGDLTPKEVRIPLRQHIGAQAVAVVSQGQRVAKGDLIGEIPDNALGARVHASVAGTVREVGDSVVISAS